MRALYAVGRAGRCCVLREGDDARGRVHGGRDGGDVRPDGVTPGGVVLGQLLHTHGAWILQCVAKGPGRLEKLYAETVSVDVFVVSAGVPVVYVGVLVVSAGVLVVITAIFEASAGVLVITAVFGASADVLVIGTRKFNLQ